MGQRTGLDTRREKPNSTAFWSESRGHAYVRMVKGEDSAEDLRQGRRIGRARLLDYQAVAAVEPDNICEILMSTIT
jgi:hypothetical protein